jgi:hypothetical protein
VVEILVEELRGEDAMLADGLSMERQSHIVGGLRDVGEGDRNARHDGRYGGWVVKENVDSECKSEK